MEFIAGIDEAGRGPMAGPVVAAAAILDPAEPIEGLKDSKQLSEIQRNDFFEQIITRVLSYGVGVASVQEIDAVNILQATFIAMRRAVAALSQKPTRVLVDGNQDPGIAIPTTLIISGDALEPVISAASIIAKVTRDRLMIALDAQYPEYGFAAHKGYCTEKHRAALKAFGPTPCHRRSFRPVIEWSELETYGA